MIKLKSEEEIKLMAEGGKILNFTIMEVVRQIKPGITTYELDKIAERILRGRGAEPSFLNYQGFPNSACISINDEVVHGIPGKRVIKFGDIVKIDLGSYYKGFHTDKAVTHVVGKSSEETKRLVMGCKKALEIAISQVTPGKTVGDIEYATGKVLFEHNLGPVMTLTGHGIGREIHEPPSIFCNGRRGNKEKLEKGMVLAIEPMATLGNGKVRTKSDNWTIISEDHSNAAHFEDTIAVCESGCKVLTR